MKIAVRCSVLLSQNDPDDFTPRKATGEKLWFGATAALLRLANYSYGWPETVGQVGNLQRVGNPLRQFSSGPRSAD